MFNKKNLLFTAPSFLKCSNKSMFHQWLHNVSKTHLDSTWTFSYLLQNVWSTVSKCCTFATKRIAFSKKYVHAGYRKHAHLKCLQSKLSRLSSLDCRQTQYHGFCLSSFHLWPHLDVPGTPHHSHYNSM